MKIRLYAVLIAIVSLSGCIVANPTQDGTVITQPVPVVIGVPSQVPVIISTSTKQTDSSMHVCRLNAFTSTYHAENTNRGKARLDVKKQCLQHFHEMHCPDENITCQSY